MSSLRNLAGLGEVLDETCGNDVEDVLALELQDNSGTTGTHFLSCTESYSHPWSDVASPLSVISVVESLDF